MNRDSALLSGYFYKVRNATTGAFIRWLPFPQDEEPQMSYSILTNDNAYIPTSIKQPLDIKTWLYPNPTLEMSYLSIVTDVPEDVCIKMYDIVGRNVRDIYQGTIDKAKYFEIPLYNLQRGIYFIGIYTRQGIKTLKISKL